MTIVVVGVFAVAASRSNMAKGTSESRRPWPNRMGQVIVGILLRLSKRWTKNQRGSARGTKVRAMSLVLVNVLNAISPPTGRRAARSIAIAPPSDHPAATIR
jgi:hypothetical protein